MLSSWRLPECSLDSMPSCRQPAFLPAANSEVNGQYAPCLQQKRRLETIGLILTCCSKNKSYTAENSDGRWTPDFD